MADINENILDNKRNDEKEGHKLSSNVTVPESKPNDNNADFKEKYIKGGILKQLEKASGDVTDGDVQRPLLLTRMLTEFEKLLNDEEDDDESIINQPITAENVNEEEMAEEVGSDQFATVFFGTSKQSQFEASTIEDALGDDEDYEAFKRERKKKLVKIFFKLFGKIKNF